MARAPRSEAHQRLVSSGPAMHVMRTTTTVRFRCGCCNRCSIMTRPSSACRPKLRPGDAEALRARSNLIPRGQFFTDFAETAAVVAALDLVITVDTSFAHLAGALGRPVWILLPLVPDWRWQLDRDDSPWYPTARLFRQGVDRTRQSSPPGRAATIAKRRRVPARCGRTPRRRRCSHSSLRESGRA